MKLANVTLLILISLSLPLFAQTPAWDNSGNGLLNGTYYFRNVVYLTGDNAGDLSRAIATYGQIAFSGSGAYSINAVVLDSDAGQTQNFSVSGTYSIAASGYGYISHPLSSGDAIFGLVSNNIFVGSSTEGGFNDLFVAAKIPSPQGTVASLRGSYTLAYIELSNGTPASTYDLAWQMSPDGNGNLGTVNLKGWAGSNGSAPITQSIQNVKYIFSNGAANMQFPNSSTALLAGNEYLYLSPDGNFVFGGSPNGWDFFVGVRTPPSTGATGMNGLYYHAGLDMDTSTLAAGYGTLDTFYGALTANAGSIVGHQRLLSAFSSNAVNYTYSNKYAVADNGTYTDTDTSVQYTVGQGGIRIGVGIGPYLGITAAVPVAPFSGSGVYLNPTGVLNAASSAPFTAGVAPGELITLYGSNLAPETKVAASIPFPQTLSGVQVLINGIPAPIYYVSATQASVIVPYGVTGAIAQIQVANNGTSSNIVTAYTGVTAPGIFTIPVGGLGYAAALHVDGTLVSPSSPARAGEYISVFITGLGQVSPAIQDGDAGPVSPLSYATSPLTVSVGGKATTLSYSGLAPQLAGLYQINVLIPAGLTAGDVALSIAGPDSYNSEALLPIGN